MPESVAPVKTYTVGMLGFGFIGKVHAFAHANLPFFFADLPFRTRIDCGQRYAAPAGFPAPKVSIGWLRAHVQCLYEFMAAVHEGRPGEPDLAQGIRVQDLMETVRRSAASGAWERPGGGAPA